MRATGQERMEDAFAGACGSHACHKHAMRPGWILCAVCMVAATGCVSDRGHQVSRLQETVIDLEGGARLIYSSERMRGDAGERALALQARNLYCGHAQGWACVADGTVHVFIGQRPDVDCVVSVDGEKYRIEDSRVTARASASLYCVDGRPSIWREDFYQPGDVVPTDGPMERTGDPSNVESRTPVTPLSKAR